jgi:hypothetical protein
VVALVQHGPPPWLGNNEGHHTLSHDPGEKPILTAINRWYAEQLAYLLASMKKVPEGEGTLLDNTLVVYCNELHTGWDHKPGPTPAVLAGRLGGKLKTGPLHRLRRRQQVHAEQPARQPLPRHGPAPDRLFGNLPSGKGPLPNLFT